MKDSTTHVESQIIDVYFAPKNSQFAHFSTRQVASRDRLFCLRYPVLTAQEIQRVSCQLSKQQKNYLRHQSVATIVGVIAQAAAKWTDPAYSKRQIAERILPALTGYDADMIRLELKRFVRLFRKKELLRFLQSELGQSGALLDDFQPQVTGGFTKAFGPTQIFHVFAGNVPGLPIWSLVMGLMVKAANLGKTSFAEPLFPVLFAQSIAEVDAELADTIAIFPWQGGSQKLEQMAIQQADAVIVNGSDETVTALREQVPFTKTFLHYGHKVSCALVGAEALTPEYYAETVRRLTEDIGIYDQQSCLAPQTIFVEAGGVVSPRAFAGLLGASLNNYQIKRPRAPLNEAEKMAIHRLRQENQLQALVEETSTVIQSQGNTAWTVVFHEKPIFSTSPLNRSVHVSAIEQLEQVADILGPYRRYLQSCGIAVKPQRLFSLSEVVGAVGINRLSALGEMNHVQAGWHHDGGLNLLRLLTFTDIEGTAERYAEKFDPDVE